jgi:hypothetical protein
MTEINEIDEGAIQGPGPGEVSPGESIPAVVPKAKAKGGKRPGCGRPRNGTFPCFVGDAQYARELLSLVMRDTSQALTLRVKAAMVVATRGNSHPGRPRMIFLEPIIEPVKAAE